MANGKTGKSSRRGRDTASQRKKGVVSERTSNAKSKDQYFTKPEIAQGCWGFLREHYGDKITKFQFVEPSAGKGSFSRILPAGSLAFDIDPQAPGIEKADFLKILLPAGEQIVVIGNPPFGKNANLAVEFFNHAANKAAAIAMILPRTFLKASLQNRLDPSFKLVAQMDIPKNAFTFEGEDFDADTVFLIWERQSTPRAKIVFERSHPDFVFTTWEHADFAIWRVGAKAGEIHHDFSKSKSSHYFIKVLNKAVDVEAIMSRLPFEDLARNTVGVRSISKHEIIVSYKSYMANMAVTMTAKAALPEAGIRGNSTSCETKVPDVRTPVARRARVGKFQALRFTRFALRGRKRGTERRFRLRPRFG